MTSTRRRLARYLVGDGLELGPGHVPYELPFPGASVRLVDRWEPERNADLFPELAGASFPRPDIVANLDVDRIAAVGDESVDFVIASHVLEHLAEPLGLLEDIDRVLRPGGLVLILLPDRRKTFDVDRPPTELEDLVRKRASGRTTVTDDEIVAFLEKVDPADFARLQGASDEERKRILDTHRLRSIHVHCWTEEEFAVVLAYSISDLGQSWEFLDGTIAADEGEAGIEFGYVLRKQPRGGDHTAVATRFRSVYGDWLDEHRGDHAASPVLAATRRELDAARAELAAFRQRKVVRAADRVTDLVQRTLPGRTPV